MLAQVRSSCGAYLRALGSSIQKLVIKGVRVKEMETLRGGTKIHVYVISLFLWGEHALN